jgi:hypothetical protein
MCDTGSRSGMQGLLWLFFEATAALAIGVGLVVGGIAAIGAALIVVGIALAVLYAILLNQRYNLALRKTWQIEHERNCELARIESNNTINVNLIPRTQETQY